jgi:glucokinase
MRYGYGVDIYGTNTKIGFFDETGTLIEKWKMVTPMLHSGSHILPSLAYEIEQHRKRNHLKEDDILGIGVGVPGPVSSSGVVNKCVNFGWGVFNIDHALAGLTGLRVKSGNIANLSALGECWQGGGSPNMVFLAMNTGLGGAVVCDGKVVFGSSGGGGEVGHMIVNSQETEWCTCGRRGCVEQYVSPTGILRVARRYLNTSKTPSPLRIRPIFDYKDVLIAAEMGDKAGKDIMRQVYDYAGQFLASVCCVTNPDTVILGGEFCRIGQNALEGIARHFHKYVFHANENVRFDFAALGTDACIYGAFKLLLDSREE